MNWRLESLDKKQAIISGGTGQSEELIPLEGDGDAARQINRLMAYCKKLEMELHEKIDKKEADQEFNTLRDLISSNSGTNSAGLNSSPEIGLSLTHVTKLNDINSLLSEHTKQLTGL